jgi:hypothetical protein
VVRKWAKIEIYAFVENQKNAYNFLKMPIKILKKMTSKVCLKMSGRDLPTLNQVDSIAGFPLLSI